VLNKSGFGGRRSSTVFFLLVLVFVFRIWELRWNMERWKRKKVMNYRVSMNYPLCGSGTRIVLKVTLKLKLLYFL
jgi:hypothetical protein